MAKVTGAKAYAARLKRITDPEAKRAVGAALYTAAQNIQAEAQNLITTGSQGGKNHVPSRPGEPPNNDLGGLVNSIEAVQTDEIDNGILRAQVTASARYAAALEYGTSKMAERPYMRPAAAKIGPEASALVRDAIDKIVKGARLKGAE